MKPSPMEMTARDVVARLRESGHIAYFAGGCVRDMVRDRIPKDFDIATDARPEVVQQLFSRTHAVGVHFGVILVLENNFQFEVATFRSDDAYIDGRHPSAVHFSSPEEDAKRRDFTINGMFYDPVAEKVIDFIGGCADIEAKLVRAIGDPAQRFAEDRLRMLRAVRLATILDYKIDKQTWDALLANAGSINEISAERIRDELIRIFLSPNRARGWDLLDSSGLMRAGLPEIDERKGCKQPEQFHPDGDVFDDTVEMVRQHMVFKDVPKMREAKLKRFIARPTFDDELELHRVDCEGSHRMLDNYEFLLRKREEFASEPIIPPPLVRGDDLIALGLKPGPRFGEILEAVERRQLEGNLRTREEALEWVKREYALEEGR